MKYWILSIPKNTLLKHPEHHRIAKAPRTPYNQGDSDPSTQLIGYAIKQGVERAYWISPELQVPNVVRDLNQKTKPDQTTKGKIHVQPLWSIPTEFTTEMRELVDALLAGREYRSDSGFPEIVIDKAGAVS